MKSYSENEIKGLCEAYQVYNMLYIKDKEKVPKDFVNQMENVYLKFNKEFSIETPLDINDKNISDAGLKYIAYMYLFIDKK